MNAKLLCATVVAVATLGPGLLHAQAQSAPWRPSGFVASGAPAVKRLTPEQKQERRFLQEAAAHLRLQGEAARLALQRGGSLEVRQLAASMLEHNGTAQVEVLHLLHVRGMAMPLTGNDEVRVLKTLARLDGARFDRVFVDEVVVRLAEVDTVSFEKIAGVTKDPQLQAWANRQLPTVRYHLAQAQRTLPDGARLARTPRPAPGPRTDTLGAGAAPAAKPTGWSSL